MTHVQVCSQLAKFSNR